MVGMRKYLIAAFFAALLAVEIGGVYSDAFAGTDAAVSGVTAPSTASAEVKLLDSSVEVKKADAGTTAGSSKDPPVEKKVEGTQSWWQALLYDVVFNFILPVFTPVILALLMWLLRKWGLKIEYERLEKVAEFGSNYAEQKGAEWLKEKGAKSPGAKKEEWAWELVESLDKKLKGSKKLQALLISKIPGAEASVSEAASYKPDAAIREE